MDKKPNNMKDKKNNKSYNQTKFNSSFLKENSNRLSKLGNGSIIKKDEKKNFSSINKKRVNDAILKDKDKEVFFPVYNKQNYNIKIDSKINNKGEKEYDTSYMNNMNRGISSLTQTNYIDVNRSIPKFSSRNFTLDNFIDKQIFENNLIRSTSNKPMSQSSGKLLIDNNNLLHSSDQFSPKYSTKINQIKDDYIDFLQKHFEDSTKNNAKNDTNNKELQKKINDLIQDNRLLNKALNERMNELGKIVQENLNIKAELDKSILINQKNEQKMAFYEEQLKLFKNSNNNYQKIIEELKGQNEQLNLNLAKIKNASEESKKKSEEKYKNDIEEIKKNMHDKIQIDDKNYENKIKSLSEEIKSLKEKNSELEKELQAKENVIQIMYKDNEKLSNQNNLNIIQIEQNTKQINDMKIIIQHKENLINTLKSKELEKEKAFFNNSNSSLKFENSEFVSDNITKLITDNEDNKVKLDYLNDKLKTIDKIEQKYSELVGNKKNSSEAPNKIYVNVNVNTDINQRTPRERKYNNKNHKLYTSTSNTNNFKSKYDKKESDLNKNKRALISGSLPNSISSNTFNRNDIKVRRNMVVKEIKDFKDKNNKSQLNKDTEDKNKNQNNFKNKSLIVIKKDIKQNVKEKGLKTLESESKDNAPYRGRSFYKKALTKKKTFEAIETKNEYEKESEEIKNERGRERKKNRTYKPNIFNYSRYESETDRKDERKKRNSISYYLYGIDRNDYFHIFDISNKIWLEKIKILELNSDGKADSFKRDYQYEGTLIYNTLEGVYILTGENTDALYYFNSKKNEISKICNFNNSHNNGSLMYDENNKCIYVFGGKNTTSCEYYSFYEKKIYNLPDLTIDRANASFIISNNKIFGFFGFSYGKDSYANTIEYIDFIKKDRWFELNNIKFLKKDIMFDIESTSTTYYKQNTNKILIYSGIQGENEDFITEYYLIYDSKSNSMDKINKWEINQYKYVGEKWKEYENKIFDPKGYHFAKNSRFISIPINCVPEGYNEDSLIDVLIDYKNNVHFILQKQQKIDIYRGGK